MTAFAARHADTAVPARPAARFVDALGSARRTFADGFLAGQTARAQRRLATDLHIQLLDRA